MQAKLDQLTFEVSSFYERHNPAKLPESQSIITNHLAMQMLNMIEEIEAKKAISTTLVSGEPFSFSMKLEFEQVIGEFKTGNSSTSTQSITCIQEAYKVLFGEMEELNNCSEEVSSPALAAIPADRTRQENACTLTSEQSNTLVIASRSASQVREMDQLYLP